MRTDRTVQRYWPLVCSLMYFLLPPRLTLSQYHTLVLLHAEEAVGAFLLVTTEHRETYVCIECPSEVELIKKHVHLIVHWQCQI